MGVNYKSLVTMYESLGKDQADANLREWITKKEFRPEDVDIGRLFVECFGWSEFQDCRSRRKLAHDVMENAGAVSTASFTQINNQIVFGLVMDAYQAPEFVFQKLIPTRSTTFGFEKIAGITEIGDKIGIVKEGDNYPLAGVTESYLNLPELTKRGMIVPMTREVVFFDRTGVLQDRCRDVGKWMGVNREKRAVDVIIDENAGAISAALGGHRYHYKGTSIATYGDSSGNHNWDNLAASNGIVDWTDLDNATQLLNSMVDPDTGEPVSIMAKDLIVTQQNQLAAERIANATTISVVTPGYATSANPTVNQLNNPMSGKFRVWTSPYLAFRQATDTDWFFGDVAKAFVYQEAWPMEVKSMGAGTQVEFDRDIIQQHKVSEFGAYGTREPRAMVKSTA